MQKPLKPISTRLPADIHDQLRDYAKKSGRKLEHVIAEAVEQYLGPPPPPRKK